MTNWKQAKQKLLQDKARREAYQKVDLGFEIGKMITDARIAKNMTQQKLAQLVGTKQPSIARIEKGDSLPSLSFLQKLARAFNTQLLPPRLEFLEELKQTETINHTIDNGRAWSINWTLEQSRVYRPHLITNLTGTKVLNNKEFEYVS
jgi:transcriptional regulator with XRE-family HTH domain